jgi:hypothetical protein
MHTRFCFKKSDRKNVLAGSSEMGNWGEHGLDSFGAGLSPFDLVKAVIPFSFVL